MATAHHHGNQAGTPGAGALVWILNPMLLSQKQLGQTFQRGKVEKGGWRRRRRAVPRLKPPQKEGLVTGLRSLVWVGRMVAGQRHRSVSTAPAPPSQEPGQDGSVAGAGGTQPFLSAGEAAFSCFLVGCVGKRSFGKRAGKPLTSSTGPPLEMGKLRSAGTRTRKSTAKLYSEGSAASTLPRVGYAGRYVDQACGIPIPATLQALPAIHKPRPHVQRLLA